MSLNTLLIEGGRQLAISAIISKLGFFDLQKLIT